MTNTAEEKKTFIQKLQNHLDTVSMHRKLVRQHCFACGLYKQGLMHDLSKYSLAELVPSIRYFQGYRSPYVYEKSLKGYSLGWLHHKGRNLHHWEYWYDMINGKWTPIEMPYEYVIEMMCDRIAACQTYQKEKYTQRSALEYFESRPDKNYMHENTRELLRTLLTLVADLGEEQAFAIIRKSIMDGIPVKP